MTRTEYKRLVLGYTRFNEVYVNSLSIPELVKSVAVELFYHDIRGELAEETRKQLTSLWTDGVHTLEG